MIEYLPWSKRTLDYCISKHSERMIPSLDMEFSSICTRANCIYCDSKPYVGLKMENELSKNDTINLLKNVVIKDLSGYIHVGWVNP